MTEKYIAFTFDDGPNTTVTPLVLDILEQNGAKGSFFLVGNNINEQSAKVLRSAHERGHEIDSHSLTHSDMTKLTADEISYELAETERRIAAVTGEPPRFFRPPYIAYNKLMFDTIKLPFICGRGVDDWDGSVTLSQRIDGLLEKAEDGGIILLHDSFDNYPTVEALKVVLPELASQGYKFVTVSELFAVKGVTPDVGGGMIYSNVMQTGDTYN